MGEIQPTDSVSSEQRRQWWWGSHQNDAHSAFCELFDAVHIVCDTLHKFEAIWPRSHSDKIKLPISLITVMRLSDKECTFYV